MRMPTSYPRKQRLHGARAVHAVSFLRVTKITDRRLSHVCGSPEGLSECDTNANDSFVPYHQKPKSPATRKQTPQDHVENTCLEERKRPLRHRPLHFPPPPLVRCPSRRLPHSHSFRSYYLSGFLTLQTTLDRFMFSRALPAAPPLSSASSGLEQSWEISSEEISPGFACVPPDVLGVPFPTAAYDQNLFYAAIGYLLGLAMTMVSRPAAVVCVFHCCCTSSMARSTAGRSSTGLGSCFRSRAT